ncbi:caspase family protein [Streptomyces sp. NPDC101118]|uniref:caspase, EACC1-associated type n=1 Tax=Streptomyces sp. NPDC101118 TaxID=3366109 RepID=UPI00380ABBB6
MSGPPLPERSRAVLIGVSAYGHLDALPGVRANLQDLAAELKNPAVWGLSAEHCNVTCDPATSTQALAPLRAAVGEARDTLLVYYSGHGLIDPDGGGLWLALPGSRTGEADTVLPYDWVRRALLRSRAERTIVVLDCCYGGRALGMMSATESTTALANGAVVEGTYLIASAGESVQALAPPGERNTAFTGELLTLLSEGVPDGPPFIRLDELAGHVTTALRARSRPEPQTRARNTAGRLPLFRNRAYAPPLHGITLPGTRYEVTGPARTTDEEAANHPGRDTLVDRPVTIRVMRPEHAADPARREAFVARLRARARLTHPALALVLDWGDALQDGVSCPYVVTEGLGGGTPAAWLQQPPDLPRAVRTVLDVLDALDHAHREGVSGWYLAADRLHLTTTGHVKIVDHHGGSGPSGKPEVADVTAVGGLLNALVGGTRPPAPPGQHRPAPSYPPNVTGDLVTLIGRAQLYGYRTAAAMRKDLVWLAAREAAQPVGVPPREEARVPTAPAPRPPERPATRLVLRFAAGSHPGSSGNRNEDSAYAGPRLLAVAGGRRGSAAAAEAGQVASAEVIAQLARSLEAPPARRTAMTALVIAAKRADNRLARRIAAEAGLDGMATTLTALHWSGQEMAVLHSGGSTAFRMRDSRLSQLTPDRTQPQWLVGGQRDQAVIPEHQRRTVPLRGTEHVAPYTMSLDVRTGDRYLLCTSGLTDLVSHRSIEQVLAEFEGPAATVRMLMERALAGARPSNITCVLADVLDVYDPDDPDGTKTPPVIVGAVADTRRL